jgi:hypothetical protein
MTTDVVALTTEEPDREALRHALYCTQSRAVETAGGGALLRLLGRAGHTAMVVEAPNLIAVPGEAARMLGGDAEVPEGTVWWTEVRSHLPRDRAHLVAGTFASRLVSRKGGTVWPAAARSDDPEREVEAGLPPVTIAAQPALDAVTRLTAVVMQDRPVVGISRWLQDALTAVLASDPPRTLYLITQPEARLTLPLYELLASQPIRWLVPYGEHYFDARTGAVLEWTGRAPDVLREDTRDYRVMTGPDGSDVTAADWSATREAYLAAGAFGATSERRLSLQIRTRHDPEPGLLLGGAVEAVWQALSGGPPGGWGTAEPVGNPWSREELTALARGRAPQPSFLVVVGTPGQPAIASVRLARTPEGVEEDISVSFGYSDPVRVPGQRELASLAEELCARHGLLSMFAAHRAASADLLPAASFRGVPAPLGLALGPGAGGAEAAAEARAVRLGGSRRPGCYLPFDGATADWRRLRALGERLGTPAARWTDPGGGAAVTGGTVPGR